jgi:penicillin amidase
MRMWEQRNVQQPMLNILRNTAGPGSLGSFWCDKSGTTEHESCADAVADAWTLALADLSRRYGDHPGKWRWGKAHTARSEHKPFGKQPYLSGLFNLRVPTGGDTYTVNVGRNNPRDEQAPFESTHAASLRALYDLADLNASHFMDSTGQSGNPVSPNYRDWTGKWAAVEYIKLAGRREPVREPFDTLVLEPAAAGDGPRRGN